MDFVDPDTDEFDLLVAPCTSVGGIMLEPFAHAAEGGHGKCSLAAVTSRVADETERIALIEQDSLCIVSNTLFEGKILIY